MDEDAAGKSYWDWVERFAWGRRVLAGLDGLREAYHRHLQRYYFHESTFYRWATWVVGTATILMVLAGLAGTYRVVQRHHQHKLEIHALQKALGFVARGDYQNASVSARQVLLYNPYNVPACRIMAELADHFHSPLVLAWLRRLVQLEPSVENQLILASAGLNYQKPPFPLTVQILNELSVRGTNNAGYQVVAASLALNTSRLADAEAGFARASALEPSNSLFRMCVVILRMNLTNGPEQAQSRATLEEWRLDGSRGRLVLRALVADRLLHLDAAGAKNYSSQLVANEQATLGDQLQNLGILQQLSSGELNDRLQTVQQQVATNALQVAELSAWMQANGLVKKNLDWLAGLPVALLDQAPVQMAQAQGYLQNGNWKALRDIASQRSWGDLEFLRLALVFRAWSQLGAEGVADISWNAALAEAADRHEAMTQLLELAERWQLGLERENLLLQMLQEFPKEHWTQQELEGLYYNSGNTTGLHELYGRLNAAFPTDNAYKNDLAATALLLKINLREACQLAAEAYATDPANPTEASTYAFALYVQGRDKQGLEVLQKLSPAQLAQPSVALYYGVLLAAVGNVGQAGPWLQIAQTKGHLLPEEQQLLTKALENGNSPTP